MADRQNWAAGSLEEMFYKAGTVEEISVERDDTMKRFLTEHGYDKDEITVIVNYMNVSTEIVQELDEVGKKSVYDSIERTIAEGRHKPPAPSP